MPISWGTSAGGTEAVKMNVFGDPRSARGFRSGYARTITDEEELETGCFCRRLARCGNRSRVPSV